MAIQRVFVFSFTIYLKSKQASNEHVGTQVQAIGPDAATAQGVIRQQFGGDLKVISGGTQLPGIHPYTTLA